MQKGTRSTKQKVRLLCLNFLWWLILPPFDGIGVVGELAEHGARSYFSRQS